jgi:threonine dehydratase
MYAIAHLQQMISEEPIMETIKGRPASNANVARPAIRLDLARIQAAKEQISPEFRDTPQFVCPPLSDLLRCELVIKLETANPIRSFKGRGTEVVASRIAQNFGPQAAVCASAGNLGQALAYSGRRRGIEITVIAGSSANATKIDRIRQLGATVELVEGDIEDARTRAREIADGGGAFLVEDSENLDTCEGAGTIGLELLDKFDGIDAVLLALGGGALATGVGHVFKSMAPMTEVVCIQPKGAPAMALSWRARSIITTESTDTIADGVAGRFPILAVLNDLLAVADHVPLVEEASIVEGMRMLYRHAGLIVEPSAALGIAAVLENPSRFRDKRVVSVICGSNVLPEAFIKWLHG